MDIDDNLIINHFTNEELKELESVNIPDIPDIPEEIITCLEKFLNKVTSHLLIIVNIICNSYFTETNAHDEKKSLFYEKV